MVHLLFVVPMTLMGRMSSPLDHPGNVTKSFKKSYRTSPRLRGGRAELARAERPMLLTEPRERPNRDEPARRRPLIINALRVN